MRLPRLTRALRYIAVALLGGLVLLTSVLGAAVLIAQTPWGQARLLAAVLPIANRALTGRIEVGGLGGDLLHRLVVRDLVLYDSEQQLAARVGRIELRYALLALLHREVKITAVRISDAQLHVRWLRDGRLNLAALTRPGPPGGPLPVSITAPDIAVVLAATLEPPPGSQVPRVDAQLQLVAAAQVHDPRWSIDVRTLWVHPSEPLAADIELHGGVDAVLGTKLQATARHLALLVRASGEQLNRLAAEAELRGDWELSLAADGPLTNVVFEGALRPPTGLVGWRGTAGVLDPALPWQVELDAKGVDPGSARHGVPGAVVDLQLAGHGQGASGRIELHKLAVLASGGRLHASGFAQGDVSAPRTGSLPTGLSAQLAVNLAAPELATLVRPFAPRSLRLAGALRAQGKAVLDRGQLRIDLEADGQRLRAAGVALAELGVSLHSVDRRGRLALRATALQGPLPLDHAVVDATISEESLALRASGRHGSQTTFDVDAQATGRLEEPQALAGRVRLIANVEPLPALQLPRSAVHAVVSVRSQRAQGELTLQLGQPGRGSEQPRGSARFDVPLSTVGPVDLELVAQTPVQAWQSVLPASVRSLRGLLTLHTTLRGSLQHPELALSLSAPAWQLEPLRGRNTALALTYTPAQERLALSVDAQLASAAEVPLGAMTLRAQTRLRLGLGAPLSAAALTHEVLHGAMAIDAEVLRVDVHKLLAALSPDREPAVQAGMVDASLHVTGTPAAPSLKLRVDGKQLAASSLHDVAMAIAMEYAGDKLQVAVNAGSPQQPLLAGHGELTLAMAHLLAGELELGRLPVHATVAVLPIELSQLSKLRGAVSAHAEVRGTLGTPEVSAWVRSQRVQLDNTTIGPLAVDLSLDRSRMFKAELDARQSAGSLQLSARTPVPPKPDSLQLRLAAHNFVVDYSPRLGATSLTDAVGMARGCLNADLQVQRTAWGARVRGFLKLDRGGLMMKALQQPLTDMHLDLQVEPDGQSERGSVLTLREARLLADEGRARLSGRVQLDGLKLQDVSLDAEAQKFPVWASMLGLWVDSKVAVRGHLQGDTLRLGVEIREAAVRLPKLMAARSVQELGPFDDVRLVDRAAQQAAARLQKAQQVAAERRAAAEASELTPLPRHTRVTVQLPAGLHVSGPEVHTELTGRIELALDRGRPPSISGQVHAAPTWGWVELFRHRYDLQRAQISLSGQTPPNPLIGVELMRKLDATTIYIQVSGSAQKPRLSFRSDPPIYDQSQIIAIILTGESGGDRKDPQALGMLSSLLIGQLRDQLAGRLPIDVLRVDVAGDDPMGVRQSSLEVGKFLRDDLYLGYTRRFGGATTGMRRLNADEALIEYHFKNNYKLRTLYGDANVGALDLFWSKRF